MSNTRQSLVRTDYYSFIYIYIDIYMYMHIVFIYKYHILTLKNNTSPVELTWIEMYVCKCTLKYNLEYDSFSLGQ
jgi:hypothetical protein